MNVLIQAYGCAHMRALMLSKTYPGGHSAGHLYEKIKILKKTKMHRTELSETYYMNKK